MNLLAMSWPQALVATLIVVVCFLLMVVVLLQRGRGGGLAGAFGGSGGTAAFGAKTGDVFTWITVSFGAVFFLLVIVANFAMDETPRVPKQPEVTSGEVPLPGAPEGGTPDAPPNPNVNVKRVKVNADGSITPEDGLPIEITPTPAPTGVPVVPAGQQPPDEKVEAPKPAGEGAAPPPPSEKPTEQPKDPAHP